MIRRKQEELISLWILTTHLPIKLNLRSTLSETFSIVGTIKSLKQSLASGHLDIICTSRGTSSVWFIILEPVCAFNRERWRRWGCLVLVLNIVCISKNSEKLKYFPKGSAMARISKMMRTRRRREDAGLLGIDGGSWILDFSRWEDFSSVGRMGAITVVFVAASQCLCFISKVSSWEWWGYFDTTPYSSSRLHSMGTKRRPASSVHPPQKDEPWRKASKRLNIAISQRN